jgi:hypothetical protein
MRFSTPPTQERDGRTSAEQNTGLGGGISNRGPDREVDEQEKLPERGSEKSED